MTTGNPMRQILIFALPLFLGNIFQQLYNTVDTLVVGRFVGSNALAAVGSCAPTYSLIIALVFGFTSGGGIVVAQFFGAGDSERIRKSYMTANAVMLVIGIALSLAGLCISYPLLRLMQTPEVVFNDALIYLRYMCIGILATCLYNWMSSFLRSVGNSVIPLVALVIASLVNVGLDLLFVLKMNMGVSGVAIATVLSQLISGIYCLIYIRRKLPEVTFRIRELRIDPEIRREVVRLGLPASFSSVVVTASAMLVQLAVNMHGEKVMAAYATNQRVEIICMCLGFSIGMATGVFAAQNKGAGKLDRARSGLFAGIKIAVIYHAFVCTFMWFAARLLASAFTTDAKVIEIALPVIRITAAFGIVLGVLFCFQNFLRSVSDVKPTIAMSAAEIVARGTLPFLLASAFGYFGIWWATPIGWTASLLIGIFRYRSGKWEKAGMEIKQAEEAEADAQDA